MPRLIITRGVHSAVFFLPMQDSALSVYKPNPRQYVANIPQIPGLEVWFQRASDVVRKMRLGDIDLGIVGYDMFVELSEGDSDLVVVHEALNFGHCHLALGVPAGGKFTDISTLEQLRDMPCWTSETPLRVVTGRVTHLKYLLCFSSILLFVMHDAIPHW